MNNKNIQANKIAGLINFILNDTTELKYAVIDNMNNEEVLECHGVVKGKLRINNQMYLNMRYLEVKQELH